VVPAGETAPGIAVIAIVFKPEPTRQKPAVSAAGAKGLAGRPVGGEEGRGGGRGMDGERSESARSREPVVADVGT